MNRFYTDTELGPRQSLLPSGTLWCRDAAIARTGVRRYHITELPELADSVVTDSAGMIDVVAATMANLPAGRPDNSPLAVSTPGVSVKEAADLFGVGHSNVQDAEPEIVAAVDAGVMENVGLGYARQVS